MQRRAAKVQERGGEAQRQAAAEPVRGEGQVTVGLRALDSTDLPLLRKWRNDWRIWKWCRQEGPISDSEQVRWFNRQSEDPTIRMYVVTVDDKPVGAAGLTDLSFAHSRAEFSLYVAPELHGRGLGVQALTLLLTHGFDNLGLNLIWGESFEGNPAIPMFERLGLVKEGTRRQFYFKDGKRIDAHLYSMTRDSWISRASLSAP